MTHREAFRLFRGTFLRYLGLLLLVPLVAVIVCLVTGHIDKTHVEAFGPAVLILMVVLGGLLATHSCAKSFIDDYEGRYSFKMDKAYRVFYLLLREGERHIRGNQVGAQSEERNGTSRSKELWQRIVFQKSSPPTS